MGCLVAKCSLTNMCLEQGKTAYVNLLVSSFTNSIFMKEMKVGNETFMRPHAYTTGTNSIEYFRPIGIILKSKYEGWRRFEIDESDENTIINLKRLVSSMVYDISSDHIGGINVDYINELMNLNDYQSVWEIINESLTNDDSYLYIKNEYNKHEKVYISAIGSYAHDYIMKEEFQRDLFASRGINRQPITLKEHDEMFDVHLKEIIDFRNKINIDLKFPLIEEISISSIVRDIVGEGSSYSMRGFYRTSLNYDLYVKALNDCETYDEAKNTIKDMIYSSYISNCFSYMDIPVFPMTNVNEEEYHSDSVIIGHKMINECLNQQYSNLIEDWGYESIVKMKYPNDHVYITYFYKKDDYDSEQRNEISREEFKNKFPNCEFVPPHDELDWTENLYYVYKELYNVVEIMTESSIFHYGEYKPVI